MNQNDSDGCAKRQASALFYVQHILPQATALAAAVKAGLAPEMEKTG